MSSEDRAIPQSGASGRILIGALLVSVILVIIVAVVVYRGEKADQYKSATVQLTAIADLKTASIDAWRKDRLAEVGLFAGNQAFAATVQGAFDLSPGADADLEAWLTGMARNPSYDSVYVLDASGQVWAITGSTRQAASAHVEEAVNDEDVGARFVDFHLDDQGNPHIAVVSPIGAAGDSAGSVGTLVATIDPEKFLYPLIQRWPVPSESGETLLIRRDDHDALFINDLRFKQDAALSLRIPMTTTTLPAVLAVLGTEGIVEGTDYRGVDVIADVRHIPDSPWYMVAKIDAREAYADLRIRLVGIALLALGAVVVLGLGATTLWRNRSAVHYRERYQIERERSWLRDALERSATEVYVLDPDTLRITFASEGARRNLGLSSDEILSKTLVDVSTDLDREGLQGLLEGLGEDIEAQISFEGLHRRADGTTYPVELTVQRLDSDTGPVFLGIGQDITARRTSAEALKSSEERFRLMADNLPGAVYLCRDDETWSMLYLNDRMYALTGYPRTEYLEGSRSYVDVCHPDDVAGIRSEIAEATAARRPFHVVYRIINARGATRWVEEFGSAIDVPDEPTLLQGVMFDITERVLAERELATYRDRLEGLVDERTKALSRTNEELDQTVEELQALNEELDSTNEELQILNEELESAYDEVVEVNRELEHANTTKNRFLASMSHELRTPLNSIIGFSGILLGGMAGELDEEQSRQIEMIQRSGRHLMMLVNDILDLEKIEAGAVELQLDSLDLAQTVRAATEVILPAADAKGLLVALDTPEEPIPVVSDEDRLRQILLNLLGNAVKFTDSGEISVHVGRAEDHVCVRVDDSGPGIEAEMTEGIFDEFRTLGRPSDSPQEGTGLGLAISRRLARMLGGDISVTSEPGAGASFTLQLPIDGPPQTPEGTGSQEHTACETRGVGRDAGAPPSETDR